jgi:cephalosporin-C deacetylase-like acetyl esterase
VGASNRESIENMDEFFEYDREMSLDSIETPVETDSGASSAFHITYTSARDERVSSLLTLPSKAPPYPVVLVLHGVFGHKTSPNQIKRSDALVGAGYATLRIDGQYSGERATDGLVGAGLHGPHCYRNRDAIIQTVIDLRRGVDYLTTRNDIDPERIGFTGFSMGGMIGTIFCALEKRVGAVALGITGGDFSLMNVGAADAETRSRLMRAYHPVDPVNYASRISPRPLLMINAANDDVIPRAATEALYEAARDPKRIAWYDCGHANLPDEYLGEMIRFFDSELG